MQLIDHIEDIKLGEITFADIRKMYGTGRCISTRNSQGDKLERYRVGCMTAIGDVLESVWEEAVRKLIERENETDLYRKLKCWLKDSTIAFRNEEELENYALELHAMRIFDCKEWVDYIGFNSKYRPEILHK